MEIISIIVPIVVLFFSVFTFCRYDIKIKKQKLKRFQEKDNASKKAVIEANVIWGARGARIIKLFNSGKAIAKNVVITISGNPNVFIYEIPNSLDIRPQNSIDIRISVFDGSPSVITIVCEWKDDFKQANKDIQTIQIL